MDRLADDGGHGYAPLGCKSPQSHAELLWNGQCGAIHDGMIAGYASPGWARLDGGAGAEHLGAAVRLLLPVSMLSVSSIPRRQKLEDEGKVAEFVDRTHELRALEALWGLRFQLALLWGRRRVGKTRLIQEFAEGKPSVTYQADEGTATEQLARLTDRILAYRDDAVLRAQPLSNWDAAIATLLRLAREAKRDGHPLLVVLDEFPRLVVATPRLPSMLQDAIEDIRRDRKSVV